MPRKPSPETLARQVPALTKRLKEVHEILRRVGQERDAARKEVAEWKARFDKLLDRDKIAEESSRGLSNE